MDSLHSENNDIELPQFAFVSTKVLNSLPQPKKRSWDSTAESEQPPSSVQDNEFEPELEKFSEEIQYYLCTLGFMIGFGNVLSLPYKIFENGGAVFFIPYLVSLFVVIVPLVALEVSWGQLIRTRLDEKFGILHPGLWGVGASILWLNLMDLPSYSTMLPYSLSFFFGSFRSPLPWKKETLKESLWNQAYFFDEMLQRTDSISEPGSLVPWLTMMHVIAYIGMYFMLRKGIKSTSQVVYLTVTVPYFIMAVLLIKGLTLPGATDGLRFLFVPDWEKLLDIKIWKAALVSALYLSGSIFGATMLYATARKQEGPILKASLIMPLVDVATSLMASLTIFCFLGHVAHKLEIDIKEISTGGLNLAFTAYPGLMTTLASPNLWSILFFAMLVLLGIDTILGQYDYVIAYIWDFFPELRTKVKKEIYVLVLMSIIMLYALKFVTTNGWWWFNLYSDYAAGDSLIFILLAEVYSLVVYFGLDNIAALMYARTGEMFPEAMKFGLRFVAIPMMTIIFIYSMYVEFKAVTAEPAWTQWVGRAMMVMPMVIVGLGFLFPRKTPTLEQLVYIQYGKTMKQLRHEYEAVQQKKLKQSSQQEPEASSDTERPSQ